MIWRFNSGWISLVCTNRASFKSIKFVESAHFRVLDHVSGRSSGFCPFLFIVFLWNQLLPVLVGEVCHFRISVYQRTGSIKENFGTYSQRGPFSRAGNVQVIAFFEQFGSCNFQFRSDEWHALIIGFTWVGQLVIRFCIVGSFRW